jgi:regulation of enolase protein 1 (concanavalin A-like superfamily)
MLWLNEPPQWHDEGGVLSVVTGEETDFWRKTHYGFIRDDGHFRYEAVAGDFTAEVAFSGRYEELYDQAGLMLRLDEENWINAGIEFVEGRQMLSVVVTRDFSDWSTAPLPEQADWLRIRLSRHGSAVRVEWARDEVEPKFRMLRLACFPSDSPVLVGPMCCSPQRAGFEAKFRGFSLSETASDQLHGPP